MRTTTGARSGIERVVAFEIVSDYTRLKPALEPQQNGKVVAIEVESGGYVLGNDELDATLKALEQFPGKVFHFIRVGSPVMHTMRSARHGVVTGMVTENRDPVVEIELVVGEEVLSRSMPSAPLQYITRSTFSGVLPCEMRRMTISWNWPLQRSVTIS
jgi:hypothetical protein